MKNIFCIVLCGLLLLWSVLADVIKVPIHPDIFGLVTLDETVPNEPKYRNFISSPHIP